MGIFLETLFFCGAFTRGAAICRVMVQSCMARVVEQMLHNGEQSTRGMRSPSRQQSFHAMVWESAARHLRHISPYRYRGSYQANRRSSKYFMKVHIS